MKLQIRNAYIYFAREKFRCFLWTPIFSLTVHIQCKIFLPNVFHVYILCQSLIEFVLKKTLKGEIINTFSEKE